VNEPMLIDWTDRLGGQMLDPIKTTNVQQQRCMTTWCVVKLGNRRSTIADLGLPIVDRQS
jgi:tellurite methyltransferase